MGIILIKNEVANRLNLKWVPFLGREGQAREEVNLIGFPRILVEKGWSGRE